MKEAPSNLAILGRYILDPEIMPILETTQPGAGGEIQLTDAIRELARRKPVIAHVFTGRRYDVGDKQGFLEATVEFALKRPDLKDTFADYLRQLVATFDAKITGTIFYRNDSAGTSPVCRHAGAHAGRTDCVIDHIPLFDPLPQYEALAKPIQDAVQRVFKSGWYYLGPKGEAFESEIAAYLGVRHAIGVNSGTDALVIGLRCLGIQPGDEVITTPFTFFATAEAICLVGATPVFVDIEPDTYNIDPEAVERAITPRTRCIIPVHLFGHSADMAALQAIAEQHDLVVLEDAAQALGAETGGEKVGTLADVGAFSFFPTKTLGAYGDGGLIATNNDEVAERGTYFACARIPGPRSSHCDRL